MFVFFLLRHDVSIGTVVLFCQCSLDEPFAFAKRVDKKLLKAKFVESFKVGDDSFDKSCLSSTAQKLEHVNIQYIQVSKDDMYLSPKLSRVKVLVGLVKQLKYFFR
eukprot:m.144909 g.144909  ORF g.144909 m.144909 type:complete len:106 (-) comp16054_c0_seq1:2463-2780(-)